MDDNARLDRIEEKIDKLSDAMIAMARAEEKLMQLEEKYTANYDRMNRFSEKLDRVEDLCQENSHTINIINRLFWIAIVAAAGSIAAQMWM